MDMENARAGTRRDAAWAVIGAALLLCPALAPAQSSISPRLVPKPVCEYKGVMSDAEIERCTGHVVRYYYGAR